MFDSSNPKNKHQSTKNIIHCFTTTTTTTTTTTQSFYGHLSGTTRV